MYIPSIGVVNFLEQKGKMNALFDDFLAHYWTLRVALRLFQRRESHAAGPQRLVLGDAYLPNKIGAFVVGDGILVKNKTEIKTYRSLLET